METEWGRRLWRSSQRALARLWRNTLEIGEERRLTSLGNTLAALANRTEPEGAAEIAKSLVAALENQEERAVDPLDDALETDSERMADQHEADLDRLVRLSQTLGALTNRMEPSAAAQIASQVAPRVAAAVDTIYDPSQIEGRVQSLVVLAKKLEPQAAAEVAKCLVSIMENRPNTYADWVAWLGQPLAALVNKMEPKAATEMASLGARRLAAILEFPQKTGFNFVPPPSMGRTLTALATKMEPQAAVDMLLQRVSADVPEGKEQPNDRRLLVEVCAQRPIEISSGFASCSRLCAFLFFSFLFFSFL